jgi:hypothetical protein
MSVEAPAAPVSDAMEGVVESAPSAETTDEVAGDATPEEAPPEVQSETLYIQNLNEKIKTDGMSFISSVGDAEDQLDLEQL